MYRYYSGPWFDDVESRRASALSDTHAHTHTHAVDALHYGGRRLAATGGDYWSK